LLECAEGTAGQLRHFYGDQSDEILARIRFVYLSHMHADHLGGLYGLVRQRRHARKNLGLADEKLLLLCPNKYADVGKKQWDYFADHYQFDKDIEIIFNRKLNNGLTDLLNNRHDLTDDGQALCKKLQSSGLYAVQTVLVEHIYDAHALVIKHVDGWSMAFSGDCKPSNNFIKAGQHSRHIRKHMNGTCHGF
jgi:ribonuclease Z